MDFCFNKNYLRLKYIRSLILYLNVINIIEYGIRANKPSICFPFQILCLLEMDRKHRKFVPEFWIIMATKNIAWKNEQQKERIK
jgi:hypothetical protein